MLVDKKKFKELRKEAGGFLSPECTAVAKILDAPDLKKVETCNIEIYSNGLYLSFLWSYKLYFPMNDFKEVKYDCNVIEIYLEDRKMIKFEIGKEKDLLKFNEVLHKYLGNKVGQFNYDNKSSLGGTNQEKILDKKSNKERVIKEKQERKAEMERLRNAGRTVSPYKQPSNQPVQDNNIARCPKCGSTSLSANKKGFSLAKGAVGVATVGVYGAVAAGLGKNKVLVTCLKCGHQWKAGKK